VVLDKTIIDQLPKMKCICVMATGFNVIDVKHAKSKGILVCNVSGYSGDSVTQHVFALLLEALNNVSYYNEGVHDQKWAKSKDFTYYDKPIRNIKGKNFGIIGFGNIGKKVGQVADSFGMNVLVYNRSKVEELKYTFTQVDQETLFKTADFISLHAPLNDDSSELINKNTLKLLKTEVVLINTARGGLINESDLKDFLDSNPKAIACLDVLNNEPPQIDNSLTNADNCIITPHQAWVGDDARKILIDGLVENIVAFQLEKPINVVN
jgi:glycerate dehydrogenase